MRVKKIWDLATRRFNEVSEKQFKKGFDKYKVELVNFNGRNPFNDAREEAVDLSQYLTQAEEEFNTMARYLFVFAISEGFWSVLPKLLQDRILMVVGTESVSTISQQEKIEFYGTNKRIRSENF